MQLSGKTALVTGGTDGIGAQLIRQLRDKGVTVITSGRNPERCAATRSDGFEVIVLDNASADGSPELIRQRFPCVRLVASERNLGFAGGNNRAAELATGEFLARIRGALRHRLPMGEAVFRSGRLEIDFNRRIVSVAGNPLKCTRIEYNLLKLLVTHAGKVVTQSQIMREVWEPGMENETNILRVYICNLRKKIEENPEKPELIITEPAVGYRLVVQG